MALKSSRRQQILEALVKQLETAPGERITTANLARALDVSEAALYRHFASKAQMFDALMEFAEEAVFGTVRRLNEVESQVAPRCKNLLYVLLGFAERNPGIARILSGDALVGEKERLRKRVSQFFDRLETELRQLLREAEARRELPVGTPSQAMANLLLAVAEGRLHQFVQSDFQRSPLTLWDEQWKLLLEGVFPR